jgi:trimethylamine--corrinoid protein Co-methyltransferase
MVRRGLTGGIFRLISGSEIEAIHSASLQILQHVGLSVKSQKIFNVFKSGGAEIDEKNLVRIPEHLVKECLNKAPRNVLLGGRNEENDIILENGRVHFGLGGSPNPYTLDVETGDFRVSNSEDVVRTSRLGDALPNISFVMSLGGAFDVPFEIEWLHEASLMLRNTQKPIAYTASGSEGAKYLLELAAAVRGGFDQLERRPAVLLFSEPLTPLVMPEINEAIIEFAKVKSPVA